MCWVDAICADGFKYASLSSCDGCDHIIGNIPKPIRTSKSSPIEPLSVLRRGTTVERVVLHPFCHLSFVNLPMSAQVHSLLVVVREAACV
jgi:hypothetical protein